MYKNISLILKSALSYFTGKKHLTVTPLFVQVEISSVCNLKCVKCIQSIDKKWEKGFMKFELFKKIMDELSDSTISVGLYGLGESLLHPKFFDMLKYVSRKKLKTLLHTNATLLDIKVSKELLKFPPDIISFSFDGYDKEHYEKLQAGADFFKTVSNIKNFLMLKKELNLKRPYTVIQYIEYQDILNIKNKKSKRKEFKKNFQGLPVDEFNLVPYHNWGGKIYDPDINKKKYTVCSYPWYHLFIRHNGDIIPCCMDCFGVYTLGNIEKNRITDVWNNRKMVFLRRSLFNKEYGKIELCRNCNKIWKKNYFRFSSINFKLFRKFFKLWL